MKDRIRQLMEHQHMNQQSFANFIGLSPATLSSILQERTQPTMKVVSLINDKMPNVSLSWLITGKGEMIQSAAASDQPEGAKPSPTPSAAPNNYSQGFIDFGDEDAARSSATVSQQQVAQPSARMSRHQASHIDLDMKKTDKPSRRITEIRVFYDDQTWESFVPKK